MKGAPCNVMRDGDHVSPAATRYAGWQLLALALFTLAFRNQSILGRWARRACGAVRHAGLLRHAESTQVGGWAWVLSGGVCPLGDLGYAWLVGWALLSSALVVMCDHIPRAQRARLHGALAGGTAATAAGVLVLALSYNRALLVRALPGLAALAGALATLVPGGGRSKAAHSGVARG